jgi:hypothetical protein
MLNFLWQNGFHIYDLHILIKKVKRIATYQLCEIYGAFFFGIFMEYLLGNTRFFYLKKGHGK